MYLIERHIVKNTKNPILNELCFKSKNLYNYTNYLVRQTYFETSKQKEKGKLKNAVWLRYYDLQKILKNHESYKALPAQTAQQIIKQVEHDWLSFFKSIKVYNVNKSGYTGKPRAPKYKDIENGRNVCVFPGNNIRIIEGKIRIPKTDYFIKTKVEKKNLVEVRLVPQNSCYQIEVVYKYENPTDKLLREYNERPKILTEKKIKKKQNTNQILERIQNELNVNNRNTNRMSIDMGVSNFATLTNNLGLPPLIINGNKIKTTNQYYNQKMAEYQSKLMLSGKKKPKKKNRKFVMTEKIVKKYFVPRFVLIEKVIKKVHKDENYFTNNMRILTHKRNCKMSDSMNKISKYIVDYCKSNNVPELCVGKNPGWKQVCELGKKNNQNFIQIPHAKFIDMLRYKCEMVGIKLTELNESHTSKVSFLDSEEVCHHDNYVGKRIKRGLFRTAEGILINADVNGSLNIGKKAYPDVFNMQMLKDQGEEGLVLNPIKVNVD